MNQEPPLLSIVVPVRNQSRKLTLFLFEIYRYFESRKETFEVIVVDDGSRDQTSYVVEKLSKEFESLKVIAHSEPLGLGLAARKGISESAGSFIVLTRPSLGSQGLDVLLGGLTTSREGVFFEAVPLRSTLWPPALFFLALWKIFHWVLGWFVVGGVSARLGPILFSRSIAEELVRLGHVVHGGYEFELILLAKKMHKPVGLRPSSHPFTVWSFPFFYFLTVIKEVVRVSFRLLRK